MLETVHKNSNTITMVYDSDGMRTHKNTVTYEYDSDKKLISMTKGSNTLLFYYDTDGNPIAVKKGNNIYYYIRNLQGDIVKIVNKLDRAIVNYEYDEWGRILSITNRQGTPITSDTNIGLLNPFRYRGYVYDDETCLYYLQSRYYDPVTGRFINADDTQYVMSQVNVLASNAYTYCVNNPVNNIDPKGSFLLTLSYQVTFSTFLCITSSWLSRILPGVDLSLLYMTVTRACSLYNLDYNLNFRFNGYINGQALGQVSQLRIGFFNTAHSGCSWIAIYNTLVTLGERFIVPAFIISYLENWGCLLNGALGALPDAVANYFRLLGYIFVNECYFPVSSQFLILFIRIHRAAIIFYWHGSGAHFVSVKYHFNDNGEDEIWIYNRYSNEEIVYKYPINKFITEFWNAYTIIHVTGII